MITRIPLHPPHFLPSLFRTMASSSSSASESLTVSYPIPVSPPYPELSKDVELKRAIAAESRSATYTLNPNDIVFEDTWIAVVNKPAGIYCETLLSSFSSRLGTDSTQSNHLHLANRLDRDTSGVMLISKSNKASAKLVHAFTHHEIKKTYIALCSAPPPKWRTIRLVSGHGRSKFGAWRVYATSDIGRKLPGGSTVRNMATSFQVLSINGNKVVGLNDTNEIESVVVGDTRVEEWNGDEEASSEVVVRAYPESGRTHQIRLHCQYLGIPIRGDVKYRGILEWKGVECEGHALHAESLSFKHPITGEPVSFCAPAPVWIEGFSNLEH